MGETHEEFAQRIRRECDELEAQAEKEFQKLPLEEQRKRNQYREDSEWMFRMLSERGEEYVGKVILVYKRRVIYVGNSHEDASEWLKRNPQDSRWVISHVHDPDAVYLAA